jgi:diamine N-acetyltransferase
MATTANHLLLCLCGGVWKPLAIHAGDEVVGLVRWGFDPDDGHHWIGGFSIDRAHQGKRIGSAALSWAPENLGAARLYRSFGFVGGGEPYGVTVARLAL